MSQFKKTLFILPDDAVRKRKMFYV